MPLNSLLRRRNKANAPLNSLPGPWGSLHASGMKTVNIIQYLAKGVSDKTVGRLGWETDQRNRDRLGHPRSSKPHGGMRAQCTVGPVQAKNLVEFSEGRWGQRDHLKG